MPEPALVPPETTGTSTQAEITSADYDRNPAHRISTPDFFIYWKTLAAAGVGATQALLGRC